MKPIWLKIKGLNSFLDAQEIDFKRLTNMGIFGIFGPTGSGKSSILDGMTLALFGTTSRNSTNFIHVNTDRASVEYMFSIKEKTERTYRVSRSFKRSKEGTIRSDSAKFVELTGEEIQVLADRVGTVNDACKEVLGLSKEDFFRTVVLPQGKFSEFLKLEGMERNKMLERLFHLEKYGEQLAVLIKNRSGQLEGEKREREGALSKYRDVTPEEIERLQHLELEQQSWILQKQQELEASRKNLDMLQKTLTLMAEYEALLLKKGNLEEQSEEILLLQASVKDAETANELWEHARSFEETEQLAKETEAQRAALFIRQKEKEQEATDLNEKRQKAQQQIQTEKPVLSLQLASLQEAVKLLREKTRQEGLLQEGQLQAAQLHKEIQIAHEKMTGLLKDIENRKAQKEQLYLELEKVTVPAKLQQAAETGYRLLKELHQDMHREEQLRKKQDALLTAWEQLQKELCLLTEETSHLRTKEQQLADSMTLQTAQLADIGNMEREKEFLIKVIGEQDTQQELLQEEARQKQTVLSLMQELSEKRTQKEAAEKKKETLEKQYLENLASVLAAELQEGEPCPVCGSRHHVFHHQQEAAADLKALLSSRQKAAMKFQAVSEETARLEARLEHEKEKQSALQERLSLLNREYLKQDTEKLKQQLQEKEAQKQGLEKALEEKERQRQSVLESLHQKETQKAKRETEAEGMQARIKEVIQETEAVKTEQTEKSEALSKLQRQWKVRDFAAVYQEIREKNIQREELQKQLPVLESAIDARVKNREKGEKLIQEKQTAKAELDAGLLQLTLTLKELERQIREKAQTSQGLETRCDTLEEKIKQMDSSYEQLQVLWEKAQQEANQLQQTYAAQEARAATAQEEAQKQKLLLQEKMKAFQIQDYHWIAGHKREEVQLAAYRQRIEAFQEQKTRLEARLDMTKQQLAGKTASGEETAALDKAVKELETALTEQNKSLGAVKQQLAQFTQALLQKQQLSVELEAICKNLGILQELEGLFRGKRFVEYVSRYYLEYVSREADQCLKDMTGNTYGLETDGNGMFIIRDYKNGGVCRSASTLSGGETFMASLALALALSSQLQLKGAAPLELFFLDEGFGTLDEACLEVVMEALERIRGKRRSVGVITHVEEIKARIPVRLVVEPAKMGEGGSRLHIEQA